MLTFPGPDLFSRVFHVPGVRSGLCWCYHHGQPALVKAMVEKAACSGWEQLYFTGSLGSINPYGEAPTFWSSLVDEVSQDINIVCPNSAESRMRIMVPLLSNPVPAGAYLFARCGYRVWSV